MEIRADEPTAAGVTAAPHERPWIFGVLIAPVAVLANGLIGGALFFLLHQRQGVGAARAAEIVAFLNLPNTIYFLWSPITDFWMRRRTWLMVAATAAAAVMLAAFHQPSLASPVAVALMFLSACLGQLIVAGLAVVAATYCWTGISRVTLFWTAFIVTRPLGATVGGFLDKLVSDGGTAPAAGFGHARDLHLGMPARCAAASRVASRRGRIGAQIASI